MIGVDIFTFDQVLPFTMVLLLLAALDIHKKIIRRSFSQVFYGQLFGKIWEAFRKASVADFPFSKNTSFQHSTTYIFQGISEFFRTSNIRTPLPISF